MTKSGFAYAVVLGLVAAMGCGAVISRPALAQEAKMNTEERQKFLKDFVRGGLSTTPGDAMFLRVLIESAKCKRGVEIGTYHGFGAINMGIALERTGGQLVTLEIDPAAAKVARENVKKVGMDKIITVIEGDALKVLPTLEGEFDFVFIDAAKPQYLGYLKALEPKLKPGALIVADNVIQSANAMKDFLEYVNNSPNYDTATIRASMDKRDGMTLSCKVR